MKSSTPPDLLIGHLLDGRYRLLARIGKGGMGAVYSALQETIERQVAVKLLRADLAEEAEMAERFVHEARAVSLLRHPHIVTIHDFGQSPEGLLYMVMELISGESLRKRLDRVGPLSQSAALHIAEQICDALVAAHDAGVLHRDLKPDNFMLTRVGDRDDFVKVLDFGIAKLTSALPSNHTATGMLVGTPMYMSPEYIRNQPWDHRSDLYALGVVLYEMLSGCHPFAGENQTSVLLAHLEVEFPPVPQIADDGPLGALLRKATAKNPDQRFQSARALLGELQRLRAALPASSEPFASARVRAPMDDVPTLPPERTRGALTRGVVTSPRRLRGASLAAGPAPETEPVDLTQARSRLAVPSPSLAVAAVPPPRRPSRTRPVLLTLAALGAVGALVFALRSPSEPGDTGFAHGSERAPPPVETGSERGEAKPELLEAPLPGALRTGSALAAVAPASLAGGQATSSALALRRVRVGLRSSPTGATVFIDGEERGVTPQEVDLPVRDEPARVRLQLRGYAEHAERVELRRDAVLEVKLRRAKVQRLARKAAPSGGRAVLASPAVVASPAGLGQEAPRRPPLVAAAAARGSEPPAATPLPRVIRKLTIPLKKPEERRKIYGMEFEQ